MISRFNVLVLLFKGSLWFLIHSSKKCWFIMPKWLTSEAWEIKIFSQTCNFFSDSGFFSDLYNLDLVFCRTWCFSRLVFLLMVFFGLLQLVYFLEPFLKLVISCRTWVFVFKSRCRKFWAKNNTSLVLFSDLLLELGFSLRRLTFFFYYSIWLRFSRVWQ